ncbi:MAG TPA: hypothetical protein VHG28_23325 [Longimicrobiaceae bacterium]|nr:hypothetical protein [Longimicrobiaceae bacterium]
MRAALLALAVALGACAPRTPAPGPGAPQTAEDRVVGTVRVTGSLPVDVQVNVQEPGGRFVRVTGPLAAEVRRLSGAVVEVWGRPAAGGAIEAAGYEVRSVDGAPVVMGMVERAAEGGFQLRRRDGSVVRLTGATSQLRVGQKVWVQGASTVQVQSYGVITP